MKCTECGQRSDWIGDESRWSAVNEGEIVLRQLYECDVCGYRQLIG